MELILFKSEEDLIREGIERLELTELTVSGSSGKVARLLLNIVNSILGDQNGVYQTLRINHLNAFLSTASGNALDSIGLLQNINRIEDEDDETYRYRISQSTTILAKANEASIRLAALSVNGVQDVLIKQFAYGAGSFCLYVISDFAITSDEVISNVYSEIEKVKAYGIKFKVLNPLIKDVKMNILLTFYDNTDSIDKNIIRNDATSLVVSHINSLALGAELDIYELRYSIMNLSSFVKDALITSIRIDNEIVFVTNQRSKWNERFLISSSGGSIIVEGE